MRYEFKLLLLFCLISFRLDAQLAFVETPFAVHFYVEENKPPLLRISKSSQEFIQISQQYLDMQGQMGSYTLDKTSLRSSKKMQFISVEKSAKGIFVNFDYIFKKQGQKLIVKVEEIPNSNKGLEVQIVSPLPNEINQIQFNFIDYSTHIYGGGIQFSHFNLKHQKFPLIVEENGVGRGDKGSTFLANLFGAGGNQHTTYAPLPRFYTTSLQSYELSSEKNDVIWEADFSSKNLVSYTAMRLGASWDSLPSIQLFAESPLEFSSLQGGQNARKSYQLHDWMQGYILGVQGGKYKVDSLINSLQENDIQVSAIWIQDWVGKRQTAIGSRLQWDWQADYSVYPDLENWIDSLHQQDIRVLAYINPYFVEGGMQTIEGIEKGVFVKHADGESYRFKAGGFEAYMIDLSNQEGLQWMKQIIQENILDTGFDGWMCDFGEWLPFNDIQLANTTTENLFHNQFPRQWLSLNQQAIQEFCLSNDCNPNDYFVFNRSWYDEDGSVPPVMWVGDQLANFGENDGLKSALTAYLSSSISGIPIVHSDIGGYTAIKLGPIKFLRSDELLKRWIELEAFTPIWRSHEGLIPEHMSQIYQDESMMAFFAKFDRIHQSLISTHFKNAQNQLQEYGYPLVRSLFMLYPNDPHTFDNKGQYFVGNDLLVCPVLEEGASSVEAYLPSGLWKHFFTEEVFEGGKTYTFAAPLGQPAVFERQ